MALDPLHEDVIRIALALPEADTFALAGGGAMLAHDLVDRGTTDVDLFTTTAGVPGMAVALTDALAARGYTVTPDRQVDTFARLVVTAPDGHELTVDLAQDARMRDTVRLDLGPVLAREDLIADKALALWGRAEARDLVDVDALATRYGLPRLLELAAEKDHGFMPETLPASIARAAAQPDKAFLDLGMDREALADLRARAQTWSSAVATDAAEQAPASRLAAAAYPSTPRANDPGPPPSGTTAAGPTPVQREGRGR